MGAKRCTHLPQEMLNSLLSLSEPKMECIFEVAPNGLSIRVIWYVLMTRDIEIRHNELMAAFGFNVAFTS